MATLNQNQNAITIEKFYMDSYVEFQVTKKRKQCGRSEYFVVAEHHL